MFRGAEAKDMDQPAAPQAGHRLQAGMTGSAPDRVASRGRPKWRCPSTPA
jgi:hypothetical protein